MTQRVGAPSHLIAMQGLFDRHDIELVFLEIDQGHHHQPPCVVQVMDNNRTDPGDVLVSFAADHWQGLSVQLHAYLRGLERKQAR